jgi:zinc transport system ATP-binding protein
MKRKIAVKIDNMSAGYDQEIVIENITCEIREGDFFGIIGPNGGGKSTLLRVILGLITPLKGTVSIFGHSPKNARIHMGYVPQYTEYDKDYPISVMDVVLMGRRSNRGLYPWYSREDRKRAMDALKKVNMMEYKNRHISDLSGGQRQRVFIARALASHPRILLLDEPTAGIDKDMHESFYNLLGVLNKNMTIILVTHDIGVISSHVTRVACLNHYMFTHDEKMITREMLEATYSCPVDLIAHGVPHRVLDNHGKKKIK